MKLAYTMATPEQRPIPLGWLPGPDTAAGRRGAPILAEVSASAA